MALTVNINGLTLCHKGSRGISRSTLPDVCKTPPGGTPVPYSNVALSKHLAQGTYSVFADGGNMIAHNQSHFAISTMDEPGSLGGVVSGVNRSRAEWISHSFDVFFERKPACRLTDKMFMNKKNTVNLAGLLQEALSKGFEAFEELICKWAKACFIDHCGKLGSKDSGAQYAHFQDCLNDKIREDSYDGRYPDGDISNEVSFRNVGGKWEPVMSKNSPGSFSSNPFTPKGGRRLDIILSAAGKILRIYDIKFPKDGFTTEQLRDYQRIADESDAEFDGYYLDKRCSDWPPTCPNAPVPVTAPVPIEAPEPQQETKTDFLMWGLVGVAVVATLCPFDGPVGDTAAWSAVAARAAQTAAATAPVVVPAM